MDKYLRFQDLKAAGVVRNRMTLSRWIKSQGFPAGVLLGPNTRAWRADDIERWLAGRPERYDPRTGEFVRAAGPDHPVTLPSNPSRPDTRTSSGRNVRARS